MRLFLAIDFPPALREAMFAATAPLRSAASRIVWVDPARLHLTLRFLGEQPETAAEPIARVLREVTSRHRVIGLALAGIGAFPNFRRPRIVWLGVERAARLELLHHELEVGLAGLGYEVEGRPFAPHITLGRVREPLAEPVRRELARSARAVDFQEETVIETVELMRSELAPGGSRYSVVASASLRAD